MVNEVSQPESRLEYFLRPFALPESVHGTVMERVHHAKIHHDDPFAIVIAADAIYEYRSKAYLWYQRKFAREGEVWSAKTEKAAKSLVARVESAIDKGAKGERETVARVDQHEKTLRRTVEDAVDRLGSILIYGLAVMTIFVVCGFGVMIYTVAVTSPLVGRSDVATWADLINANTHDMSLVLKEVCQPGRPGFFTAQDGGAACQVPLRIGADSGPAPTTRVIQFLKYHLWIFAPGFFAGLLIREACRFGRKMFSSVRGAVSGWHW